VTVRRWLEAVASFSAALLAALVLGVVLWLVHG
jgi:hypothetical protein